MSYIFLNKLLEIVKELNGYHFFPMKNDNHDITISFRGKDLEVFDHLKLKVSTRELECGVVIKSELTKGNYVNLKEYTYLLVEFLEVEFSKTISMKPLTARFYFLGEVREKNIQIFK